MITKVNSWVLSNGYYQLDSFWLHWRIFGWNGHSLNIQSIWDWELLPASCRRKLEGPKLDAEDEQIATTHHGIQLVIPLVNLLAIPSAIQSLSNLKVIEKWIFFWIQKTVLDKEGNLDKQSLGFLAMANWNCEIANQLVLWLWTRLKWQRWGLWPVVAVVAALTQ